MKQFLWLSINIILLTIILTSCNVLPRQSKKTEQVSVASQARLSASDGLNQQQNFELPFEYDYISDFRNGYGLLEKNGEWILVNDNYQLFYSTSEYELINISSDVLCIRSRENLAYGLMDIYSNILVSPQYDSPIEFSEGLALVEKGGRCGFIDTEGKLIIELKYDSGVSFHNGLAAVGNGNHFYFINAKNEIISGPFVDLGEEVYSHMAAYMEYSEDCTAFFKEDQRLPAIPYGGGNGGWGFLDRQGNVVIKPEYKFVYPFCEGLAAVETHDGKWIYINKSGGIVMEGAPGKFFNGLACVGDHFIDKTGKTVIEIPKGYSVNTSSLDGFDNFYFGDYIVVFNETENRYAVMNKQGKIVLESSDYEELKIFNRNCIAAKKNNKWGIVQVN